MIPVDEPRLVGLLRRVIRDCGKLYRNSAKWMLRRYPTLIEGSADQFLELMDDLHRGLLIKVYVTIVRADDRWTGPEKRVATAMIEHLWDKKLEGSELREAAMGLFQHADRLNWNSLVAPFVRYEPLADTKAQVETIVMRLANVVAKCDGNLMPEEETALHLLQKEIDAALHPAIAHDAVKPLSPPESFGSHATVYQQQQRTQEGPPPRHPTPTPNREAQLAGALQELDSLIGLATVKERIRSYANFLRLQQQRRDKGLSTMPISLHMTFVGNPGTGKTTVARIVGQILGSMGILPSGHVVETDRSGLVAEYAGQTAPKTNNLCDTARGGVLFIDEAYSLVDSSGDDAYGREAIQTLIKRMEDDRESTAVILAGYRDEMDQMIHSNPGLSSRINTQIDFEDYEADDLGRIFESMCVQNQYELPSDARHRLLVGLQHLYDIRDQNFGNGRLVRNAFEDTVRRLADRVASVSRLTEALLTQLTANDICVPGISQRQLLELLKKPHILRLTCTGCRKRIRVAPTSLGIRVKCLKCTQIQIADWATVES